MADLFETLLEQARREDATPPFKEIIVEYDPFQHVDEELILKRLHWLFEESDAG
jgi:hypothetical protein